MLLFTAWQTRLFLIWLLDHKSAQMPGRGRLVDWGRRWERRGAVCKGLPTETRSCAGGESWGTRKGADCAFQAQLPLFSVTHLVSPAFSRHTRVDLAHSCLLGAWFGLVAFSQAVSMPRMSLPLKTQSEWPPPTGSFPRPMVTVLGGGLASGWGAREGAPHTA